MKVFILCLLSIQLLHAKMAYVKGHNADLLYKAIQKCSKTDSSLTNLELMTRFVMDTVKPVEIEAGYLKMDDCSTIKTIRLSTLAFAFEKELLAKGKWNLAVEEQQKQFVMDHQALLKEHLSRLTLSNAWLINTLGNKDEALISLKREFDSQESRLLNQKVISIFRSRSKEGKISKIIKRLDYLKNALEKDFPQENYKSRIKKIKIYLSNLPVSRVVT